MSNIIKGFADGIKSLTNNLINQRQASSNNILTSTAMSDDEMLAVYKSGIGSKIYRLKSGHALNNTIQFQTTEDEKFYNKKMAKAFKKATKYCMGFGRGLIVIIEPGVDLSTPMTGKFDRDRVRVEVFSGDMARPMRVELDLIEPRYNKPLSYSVNGETIHWTRTIDVTYYETTERDLPNYYYGGISEAELIRDQLVNDAIVQRAAPQILEKNSTLFYQLDGFRDLVQAKKEDDVLSYFGVLENARSIYGAGILDGKDKVQAIDQTLSNLSEVDNITLRRLAMVTGIPLPYLIGENVQGLNSSGENERLALQDTINNFQSDYLLDPLNLFVAFFGIGIVKFKENQGTTALDKATIEGVVITNSKLLTEQGYDKESQAYLIENGIIKEPDAIDKLFPEEMDKDDLDDLDDEKDEELDVIMEDD